MLLCQKPVSYTHLDVYKRQVLPLVRQKGFTCAHVALSKSFKELLFRVMQTQAELRCV